MTSTLNRRENTGSDRIFRTRLARSSKIQFKQKIKPSSALIPAHHQAAYPQSAVVLEVIEDAILVCAHRTIVAYYPDGSPVDSCQLGDTKRASRIRKLRRMRNIDGSLALFTSMAPECYYHWLLDTIPGFEVLDSAGESLKDIDHFYFANYSQKFQLDTLAKYKIDESRVISTFTDVNHTDEQLLHARVDRLLIPRFRDFDGRWPNQWITSKLQTRFNAQKHWNNPGDNDERSRIYITRGNSRRRITNEEALLPFLQDNGFQVINMPDLTLEEQIATAASANMICGPHGAGLANAIFARPGSDLVEFCGPYLTRHFRILSEIASLKYRVFQAGVNSRNEALEVGTKDEDRSKDYLVNPDKVKALLT